MSAARPLRRHTRGAELLAVGGRGAEGEADPVARLGLQHRGNPFPSITFPSERLARPMNGAEYATVTSDRVELSNSTARCVRGSAKRAHRTNTKTAVVFVNICVRSAVSGETERTERRKAEISHQRERDKALSANSCACRSEARTTERETWFGWKFKP